MESHLDIASLKADIQRQSTLKKWYKHLPLYPEDEFYIVPNAHGNCALHWTIFDIQDQRISDKKIREIVMRHTFNLGPFFYHNISGEPAPVPDIHGWYVIWTDWSKYGPRKAFLESELTLEKWIQVRYPNIAHKGLEQGERMDETLIAHIFEAEFQRMSRDIIECAENVHRELVESGINLDNIDLTH